VGELRCAHPCGVGKSFGMGAVTLGLTCSVYVAWEKMTRQLVHAVTTGGANGCSLLTRALNGEVHQQLRARGDVKRATESSSCQSMQ
jgi:hypothetical protein